MKKRIVLSALVFMFLFSALVVTSSAQERTVGVNVSEWFEYSNTFDWSSSDPNATMPSFYKLLNETEWMLVSITDVSGTNVTFQRVTHLTNGTELTDGGITDIDTGEGNATIWIISANLNPNDTLYTAGGYSTWKINETIVKTYPDGVRDTNHVNLTMEMNMTGIYMYTSQNFYWDRPTGILVEMAMIQKSQMDTTQMNLSSIITITDSDVWVIPEFPTHTSVLLAFAILTVSIVMIERRLLKTPTH